MFSYSVSAKQNNEDFCLHFCTENRKLNCVIIADGIGSCSKARDSSKFAVNRAKRELQEFDSNSDTNIDFVKIFHNIQQSIVTKLETNKDNTYGTTLIIMVESQDEITIAYVGNGSCLHIRENFAQSKARNLISWGFTNYLIPHTRYDKETGKEILYKFIDNKNRKKEDFTPTIVKIKKSFNNDIFMITTDGIFSSDQIPIGKVEKNGGFIYSVFDDNLYQLLNLIEEFTNKFDRNYEDLFEIIKTKMDNMTFDDDATIGILIDRAK